MVHSSTWSYEHSFTNFLQHNSDGLLNEFGNVQQHAVCIAPVLSVLDGGHIRTYFVYLDNYVYMP